MSTLLIEGGLRLSGSVEVEGNKNSALPLLAACVVTTEEPDSALVGRLRGSVLLLGPLLARRGRVLLAPPGGDFPARRTLHTHLEALESMGARPIEGKTGHALEV